MACKVLKVEHCGPIEVEGLGGLLSELQAINATLQGELTVAPNAAWEALLTTSVTNALENADITVSIDDVVNVVVDTSAGPVEVTGTVTVAEPLNVTVSNFPTEFAISNFADLEGLELTVTLDGEVVTVTPDAAFIAEFDKVVAAIMSTIRVDYEATGMCVFDADGNPLSPPVRQYNERRYSNVGVFLSNTTVLSQFNADGTITGYTLQAGDQVLTCKTDDSLLQNVVSLLTSVIGDPNDPCPCEDGCDPATTFASFIGFDYYAISDWQAGDATSWELIVDGVVQTTVLMDYVAASAGTNKSVWYLDLVNAVNALPDWSMTLVSDVAETSSGRPTWTVAYSGSTGATLELNNVTTGQDRYIFEASETCDMVGSAVDGTNSPFGTDPFDV